MNKNSWFFASIFVFFNVLSYTVFAQKTATSVINDVLNMNYGAGHIGFRIQVVSPRDVKYADFVVSNSDIKSKAMNNLPNSPQIKYFSNEASTGQSFITSAGGNNSVLLNLAQPGLVLAGTIASLGSFVYYPSNPVGAEIKFNIPANLNVLDPNATNSFNTLFGKTTITTRIANGQTTTVEDVIYIKITAFTISG